MSEEKSVVSSKVSGGSKTGKHPRLTGCPVGQVHPVSPEAFGTNGAGRSKTDALLQGLDLMANYYALGLDLPPLNTELKELSDAFLSSHPCAFGRSASGGEVQAKRNAESLKRIERREETIKEMAQDLRDVDRIIDRYEWKENALIQILLTIQKQKRWIPQHALRWISKRLDIPLSRIYTIASFYEALSTKPQGAHMFQVCLGTACHIRGGQQLLNRTEQVLGIKPDETDPELHYSLKTVHCVGCCALGPVVKVDEDYYSNPSIETLKKIAARCREKGE